MQQLRITVIDQMEELKVSANPPHDPWIIPEAIEEAIGVVEN
jgi:hypothetical protein